jgi:hypothetical protein
MILNDGKNKYDPKICCEATFARSIKNNFCQFEDPVSREL